MENINNSEEFGIDKYNDFLKQIKAGSPVHKINFNLENPNAVVGMYLMTINDVKSYLDKVADYSDLNSITLLVFESRHVVECCQIIYGCLDIIKCVKMLNGSNNEVIEDIVKYLLTKPLFYNKVAGKMDYILTKYIKQPTCEKEISVLDKFSYIIKNIWFVPYGSIDEIAKEAICEFMRQCESGDGNE